MTARCISLVLVLWGCSPCSGGWAEADSLDVAHASAMGILRFAEHLHRQADYLRAIGEYRRYLFVKSEEDSFLGKANQGNQETDSVFYRIGQCYQSAGQLDDAIASFAKVPSLCPSTRLAARAIYQTGAVLVRMGRYGDAVEYMDNQSDGVTDHLDRWRLMSLRGIAYLGQRRWDDADRLSDELSMTAFDEESRNAAQSLNRYADEGKHLQNKSPTVAGVLSTLLPGSGKVYCRRTGDGFGSFLLVGATAWSSYDGFRHGHGSSVKGYFFGVFSGLLYVGNIYGSALAAQVHNRRLQDDLWAKVQTHIASPDTE